jgi:hypothetical protein
MVKYGVILNITIQFLSKLVENRNWSKYDNQNLQSANQDLQNANQDLQNANQDLQNANQDLQNANLDQ